jgi:hypothetical protein
MNEHDKEIIAYLLAKNQKAFTAAADGGYAITLMGEGIVKVTLRPGQPYHADDVPMRIPDHVWDVLVRHNDQFPYSPRKDGKTEPYPWRVHWMLR